METRSQTESAMKKPHKSGWRSAAQRNGKPSDAMPVIPAAFEVMLKQHGIPEAEAHKSRIVRDWCNKWRHNRYVPEDLLKAFFGEGFNG